MQNMGGDTASHIWDRTAAWSRYTLHHRAFLESSIVGDDVLSSGFVDSVIDASYEKLGDSTRSGR